MIDIKNIKGKLYQHIPTGKIEKVVYADDDCITLYDKSRYHTCFTVDFLKYWKPYEAPNDKVIGDNVEQFMAITQDMTKTYAAKNHDYGNSFEQSLDKFGLVASVVRLGDKMNRIESLTKKEAQVKDESIKDTLLDMANYAIMTAMWMNKNQKV